MLLPWSVYDFSAHLGQKFNVPISESEVKTIYQTTSYYIHVVRLLGEEIYE